MNSKHFCPAVVGKVTTEAAQHLPQLTSPLNEGPLLGETEGFSLLLQTPAPSPRIVLVQQQCRGIVE